MLRAIKHLKEGDTTVKTQCLQSLSKLLIMLSSHFYESRDGSTGGFFADTAICRSASKRND